MHMEAWEAHKGLEKDPSLWTFYQFSVVSYKVIVPGWLSHPYDVWHSSALGQR